MATTPLHPPPKTPTGEPPAVCVVIPSKNEASTIRDVIAGVRASLAGTPHADPQIVVVDDSTDRTAELASQAGAIVIRGGHVGLGYAMFRGLHRAGRTGCRYVVAVDSDGQADTAEIPRFLAELDADRADLVLASRFMQRGSVRYRYPWRNRIGVRVLTSLLWLLSGRRLSDSHGGIRAMRREVVAELTLTGTHSYVQETILDALQRGFRVVEIPSEWKPRAHGSSRVVSSIPRYAAHTLPVLLVKSGKHLTWLATMGALFVMGGVAFFFIVLVQEEFSVPGLFDRIPALLLIALLVSVGTQMFFSGLVLELLRQIGRQVDHIRSTSDAD